MAAIIVILILIVVFGAIWSAIGAERGRSSYVPMDVGVSDADVSAHHASHHVDPGGSFDAGSDCGGDSGGGGDCS